MLNNMTQREVVEEVTYSREFTDADGAGYTFPCDAEGNIFFDPEYEECQRRNYEAAKAAGPEAFPVHYDKVCKRVNRYTKPAEGDCICGTHIQLVNQYQGACQCPGCGTWYNLFGQSLIDPQYWED